MAEQLTVGAAGVFRVLALCFAALYLWQRVAGRTWRLPRLVRATVVLGAVAGILGAVEAGTGWIVAVGVSMIVLAVLFW